MPGAYRHRWKGEGSEMMVQARGAVLPCATSVQKTPLALVLSLHTRWTARPQRVAKPGPSSPHCSVCPQPAAAQGYAHEEDPITAVARCYPCCAGSCSALLCAGWLARSGAVRSPLHAACVLESLHTVAEQLTSVYMRSSRPGRPCT